ncbi:unnamed protein product [Rhizophagus irregularis]|nr:unnamed protein product [Rhizophagus irregularis]CAB5313681.1 unnamed protein product [Rhizophagus irregularis]
MTAASRTINDLQECFNEKNLFEIVSKYSPKYFFKLVLVYNSYNPRSELLPEELESFFISWKNRVPQKQLTLIIVSDKNPLYAHDENKKIIEKYTKLGIIKFS